MTDCSEDLNPELSEMIITVIACDIYSIFHTSQWIRSHHIGSYKDHEFCSAIHVLHFFKLRADTLSSFDSHLTSIHLSLVPSSRSRNSKCASVPFSYKWNHCMFQGFIILRDLFPSPVIYPLIQIPPVSLT